MDSALSVRMGRGLAACACAGLLGACSSTTTHTTTSPTAQPSESTAAPTSSPTFAPTPADTPLQGIPPDFLPMSVTFVSSSDGFVLGRYPCSAQADYGCVALVRTADGGRTWTLAQAPPAKVSMGNTPGVHRVRFADLRDGWAFDDDLWATHDGGAHWSRQTLPGAGHGSPVQSLETAGGVVHAAVLTEHGVQIFSSPVARDAWVASPTTIPIGAGPVPHAQLVLQGTTGWLVEVDRTVIGGARLSGGRWSSWQPPCSGAGGNAELAAATSTRLAAICDEGTWTGTPQGVHLYLSSDGGSSFRRVAAAVATATGGGVTMSTSGAVVTGAYADQGELLLSVNGGSTWSTVYRGSDDVDPDELGFTTATQGVAVVTGANSAHLLMTYDGGRHWGAVAFS